MLELASGVTVEHLDIIKLVLLHEGRYTYLSEIFDVFGSDNFLKFLDIYSGVTFDVPEEGEVRSRLQGLNEEEFAGIKDPNEKFAVMLSRAIPESFLSELTSSFDAELVMSFIEVLGGVKFKTPNRKRFEECLKSVLIYISYSKSPSPENTKVLSIRHKVPTNAIRRMYKYVANIIEGSNSPTIMRGVKKLVAKQRVISIEEAEEVPYEASTITESYSSKAADEVLEEDEGKGPSIYDLHYSIVEQVAENDDQGS